MKKIMLGFFFLTFMFCFLAYARQQGYDMASVEKAFLEGKYEKTIIGAQALIDERSRQRDELYYIKGLSELKTNRFKDARDSFENIISRYPGSKRLFDAYLGMGDSYLLEGNANSALNIYNDMANKFSDDKNICVVHDRIKDCRKNTGSADKTVSRPSAVKKSLSDKTLSIQVGCFKSRANAEKLSLKLKRKGYESYIDTQADKLYHVKVGKFTSREEAERVSLNLKREGYSVKVCDIN